MRRSIWLSVVVAVLVVAAACSRSENKTTAGATSATTAALSTGTGAADCSKTPLQSTDVGITATDITVEVMADVGSPLAPGLFQGNFDAMNAYATYVNAHGGIGCRKLIVKQWDTKLDPTESKNGLIDACKNAVALVGNNALFNPDVSPMTGCVDKNGKATGLPDMAALAVDASELCAPTTFVIQIVSDTCPIATGARTNTQFVGAVKYNLAHTPGLHGLFEVAGDLPTTVQSNAFTIAALAKAGIVWDSTPKISGADQQPAYTPRVQLLKTKNSNFVYDGSNDVAMIRLRKEAKAQGLDTSKIVWTCSLACYTKNELSQGGSDVEGVYVWMQFLPFEEADTNAEATAYVNGVGPAKADSFGAQAWQAGAAFKSVVDGIVAKSGPNAITRATILDGLKNVKAFTDNGWMGEKDLRGASPCFLLMQIQNGKFVRIFPTQRGTLDCSPSNLTTVTIDPAVEAAKLK
jgi:ABC-type branched-subunit amino acid transport system substrate-binding protein